MAYELAKAYVQIVPTTSGFANNLNSALGKDVTNAGKTSGKKVGNSFKNSFGSAIKGITKVTAGVITSAAGAAGAILGVATKAADNLDEVHKGAQQLGMSYDLYQKLNYACERSGTTVDSLSKGMKNLSNIQTGMVKSGSNLDTAFKSLGVRTSTWNGQLRDTDDVMYDTLMALANMDDEVTRNSYAAQIFGGAYQDLLPLLNQGSDGIKGLMQNAQDLGLVMSDDAVEGGAKFKDQLDDVKESVGAMITNIGAELMPTVQKVLDWIQEHMPEIKETCGKVFDGIMKFMDDVKPLLEELKKLICEVIWPAVKAVLESPLWKDYIDWATQAIKDLSTGLSGLGQMAGIFQGDWNSAWSGAANYLGGCIKTILVTFNPLLNTLKLIKSLIEWINGNGDTVEDVAMEMTGSSHSISAMQEKYSPKMATGGVISSAGMAIVGEAGAELIQMPKGATVTPLNNNNNAFAGMNSKLDALVSLLANNAGGDTVIPVYIGGTQIDEIIVNSSKNITTRSGGFASVV